MKKKTEFPCGHRSLEKGERVSHWPDLPRLRRVRGVLGGIIKMIECRERSCNAILIQLLASSRALIRLGHYILMRHIRTCLAQEGFPGKEKERWEEIDRALRYVAKFKIEIPDLLNTEEKYASKDWRKMISEMIEWAEELDQVTEFLDEMKELLWQAEIEDLSVN